MQEKIELNLDNPIFALYIDVSGMSRQRAIEEIEGVKEHFDIYSNVTLWILPLKDSVTGNGGTRIECIYDGWVRNRDTEISKLIEQINTRIDILSNSRDFNDFKMNIRNWRLGELLEKDGDTQKQTRHKR